MHKGISTLVAVIVLGLVMVSVVVFYLIPRHNGFELSDYPTSILSGEEFQVTVTAIDQNGKPFPNYVGSIYFTSTDINAIIPEPGTQSNPYTFLSTDNGVRAFNGFRLISIDSNASYTITLSDGVKTGTSNPITVLSQPTLHHFELNQIPSPQTADFNFDIQVVAIDQYGNTLESYNGNPTIAYSEGSINPNTLSSWSSGVATATVKVTDIGTDCTITISDPLATGTSNPFDVTGASSSSFLIDAPSKIFLDTQFALTLVAIDPSGNVDTGYLGTVHFSSDDESAILPDDYTFVSGDYGIHIFYTTLRNPKTSTITVSDINNPSRKGSVTRDLQQQDQTPSFIGFGDASSPSNAISPGKLNPTYPLNLQANDLILLHVVGVGSQPFTPTGFSLLFGPDYNGQIGQWVYYKFAVGSESGDLVFNYPGDYPKMAVMYSFRGVAFKDFVEGGGFGFGNNSLIEAQAVTTTGSNRLAVSFVFVGAQNSWNDLGFAFIGSTGGIWTHQYYSAFGSSSHLIQLSNQLQVALMEDTGTISSGTILMTKPGYWGVRAFALIP